MFPNDEVVAYGRANGLGSDYNDIMTAFLRDYYSSNLSLTDLWGRAWAEGYRSINGFTDFPGIANSEFYAPLTHSLILTRGTGDPTYSRATNAWEFDNEGKLILVPSGSARFGGARMVRNLLTYSEDMSNAAWVKLNTTASSASEILETTANAVHNISCANVASTYGTFSARVEVKMNGRDLIHVGLSDNATGQASTLVNVSNGTLQSSVISVGSWINISSSISDLGEGWYLVNVIGKQGAGSAITLSLETYNSSRTFAGDVTKGFFARKAQIENVTGQADQTASEYVSVGVLSAPFHGAGVDGVKWFNTNKDGSAISESSLLGYHAEGARTNSLLWSRDLTNAAWVITSASGGELLINGDFSAAGSWSETGNWAITGGKLTATATAQWSIGAQTYAFQVGKRYKITYTIDSITAGSVRFTILDGTQLYGTTRTSAGTYTEYFTSVTGNARVAFQSVAATALTCVIDDVSMKESDIQVTTCTGIDDAPNSASTLTAGAADATILQTLSLAAAARSFSAYVKRRTGSGSVYITRDGGTSWTDITSSLGASWTRVKIENTSVLNPSVGFKIATSGDEIDVDCVQDEAGSFISSPIITTTASVTRNTDSLSYVFAGNVNGTEGAFAATGVIDSTSTSNMSMISVRAGGASYNNFVGLILQGIGDYARLEVYSGGVSQAGVVTANSSLTHKACCRYKANDFAISSNGNAVVIDTAGSIPASLDTLLIGIDAGASVIPNYTKDVYIWSTALTDAQLQQVTA